LTGTFSPRAFRFALPTPAVGRGAELVTIALLDCSVASFANVAGANGPQKTLVS
jgi:hypothetical protein